MSEFVDFSRLGKPDPAPEPPQMAPEGYVWVCSACGKTETDRYGQRGGWDEACMLNAVLMPAQAPDR